MIDIKAKQMQKADWSKFWKDEEDVFFQIMQLSTNDFARRLDKLLRINESNRILDYGCGPGFLIDSLVDKCGNLIGVDINAFFLAQCKKKHEGLRFIKISSVVSDNEDVFSAEFKDLKFDIIVILSIVQYFESKDDLEILLRMLRKYLTSDGKIVLADVIDAQTSSVRDGLALLRSCLLSGRILPLLKFMKYLFLSDYNRLSKKLNLLNISEESVNQIAENCSLKAIKAEPLTLHPTRSSYLLTKVS